MKMNSRTKVLSALLAVLMIASTFVLAVPVSAAESLAPAEPEILWSAKFTTGVTTETGAPTQTKLLNPTNGDGILPMWTGTLSGTGIPATLNIPGRLKFSGNAIFIDYDPSKAGTSYNDFFDLMYGRVDQTSYYMEMDFIPTGNDSPTNNVHLYPKAGSTNSQLPLSGLKDADIAALYNFDKDGDGVKDTFVNYEVKSDRRGSSYFTMQQGGGGYNELFKISPSGYIYGSGGTYGNLTISGKENASTITNNDWSGYTYTYYEAVRNSDGTWKWVAQKSNQPLSKDIVDDMRDVKGADFSLGWSSALTDYSKAFKIEPYHCYKIRVEISVNKTNKKITYTTYVREDNGDTPWFKVGERTNDTLFGTSGTRGTDYPKGIRLVEIHGTKAYVDNWYFATYPTDCSEGHITPVYQGKYDIEGFNGVYSVKCIKCNQKYYLYDEAKEAETLYTINADFKNMSQSDFNAFCKDYPLQNGVFTQGTGINTQSKGTWFAISTGLGEGPVKVNTNKPYEIKFTINFSSFMKNDTGTSLITDVTLSWDWFLRMGSKDVDGKLTTEASETKAWVKMKGPTGSATVSSATETPYCTYIEVNKDYTFTIKVDGAYYEVYVSENGGEAVYMGRGKHGMTNMLLDRAYRFSDNKSGTNYVLKNFSVKTTLEPDYEAKIYDIFDETAEGWNVEFNSALVPQGTEELGFFVGNTPYVGANSYLSDKDFVVKDDSYNLSFDFMLTSNGEVNAAPTMDGNQYWSLLTWQPKAKTVNYLPILSVGAVDNNGDGVFDKHFLLTGVDAGNNQLVKASEATEEEKKNHSILVGGTTYHYTDKYSIYDLEVGEWINIRISLDTAYNVCHIYVNGELVATGYADAYGTSTPILSDSNGTYPLTESKLRFGDGFGRRFLYTYALKDVEIKTDGGFFEGDAGTYAYVNDFGSVFREVDSNWSSNKYGSRTVMMNVDPTINGVKYSQVLDTETEQGYTRFIAPLDKLASGSSKLFDISKSTNNIFSGEYIDMLSADGNKYSIKLTFAFPQRNLTDDEITAIRNTKNGDKYPYSDLVDNATMRDFIKLTTPSILRLSKWHDNNQIRLLYCNHNGLFNKDLAISGTWYFCDKDGNIYDPLSEVDENGRPLSMMTVEAVIDEWTNTYTLYVNGELAYRKNGATSTTIIPAVDMPMKVQYGDNSLTNSTIYGAGKTYAAYADVYQDAPEYKAWVESGKAYAMIPHHLTVTLEGEEPKQITHTYADWKNNSYLRFFQATYDVIVEGIEINKVRDEKIEYVGSQMKKGSASDSETTFDLRFVFGVDDIYVNSIYYNVTAEINKDGQGTPVQTEYDKNIYSSIVADGKSIYSYDYFEGNYFSVFKITGIDVADANTLYTFTISPYTIAANGEAVATGDSYVVQYNGLGEYVGTAIVEG